MLRPVTMLSTRNLSKIVVLRRVNLMPRAFNFAANQQIAQQNTIVPVFNQLRYYSVPSSQKEQAIAYKENESIAADHLGKLQNHLWTKQEIDDLLGKLYRHQPQSISDRIMNTLASICVCLII